MTAAQLILSSAQLAPTPVAELREMALLIGNAPEGSNARAMGDRLRRLADDLEEQLEADVEAAEERGREAARKEAEEEQDSEEWQAEALVRLLGLVAAGRLEPTLTGDKRNMDGDEHEEKRQARRLRWLKLLVERLTEEKIEPHVCPAGGAEVSRKLLELHEARIAPVLRAGGTLPDGMRWNKAIALRWFEAISEKLGEAEKLVRGRP